MTTVGVYVDGPNVDRTLHGAGEYDILVRVGSLLVEFAEEYGELTEKIVFMDHDNKWKLRDTRDDLEANGFIFDLAPRIYHKSLTDPMMHCHVVDRLHDDNCPDILVLATSDKDVTIPLEYVSNHSRTSVVVGEQNTLSRLLTHKCTELGFECHSFQLLAKAR